MKVKDAVKKLLKLNQEAELLVASDSEGNSYRVLSEIVAEKGLKYKLEDYQVNLYSEGDEDEKPPKGSKECVLLFP